MARALVLGSTGYVGGRLVPRLLEAGYTVRCLARDPRKLQARPWAAEVELARGDLRQAEGLAAAFADVDVVYHLVHSMGSSQDFADTDLRIARTVALTAAEAGVRRIVYLGGLGEIDERTSAHLRSRSEVGTALRAGSTPVTVLRAAVIIGSGSASFEMLRHLVERLPVMIVPRWVHTRVQPIAIRDVLEHLTAAASWEDGQDHVYDLGGPDVLTYAEMMHGYAREAGLPSRVLLSVPLLTPRLSRHWIGLVTPVPVGVAKPLVESLKQEVVVRAGAAPPWPVWREVNGGEVSGGEVSRGEVGGVQGTPYDEALRLALARTGSGEVATSWREAELPPRRRASHGRAGTSPAAPLAGDPAAPLAGDPAAPLAGDPAWSGGTVRVDEQRAFARAGVGDAFAVVSGLGGARGWLVWDWAWALRGWVDQLVGGVGLRRGRRDPDHVRIGDAVDFWRVDDVAPPTAATTPALLRLRAEMRLPGDAWLEFRLQPVAGVGTWVRQRAVFAPRGVLGRAYWWAMLPFHLVIFRRMAREVAVRAQQRSERGEGAGGGKPATAQK